MTDISMINWEKCVALTNNNPTIAKELLSLFADQLKESRKDFEAQRKAPDASALYKIVHGLSGSSAYIGIQAFHDNCQEASVLLKNPPTDLDMIQLIDSFLQYIDQYLQEYEQLNLIKLS